MTTRASHQTTNRVSGDAGQVAGIEVLPFGFLLFVAVTLLFANAWGIFDAKLAVSSAAAHGARSYSEADTAQSAHTAATLSAQATLRAYGRTNSAAKIDIVVTPQFHRCARVTVTVSYPVPTIRVPFLGGFGGTRVVQSSFSEIVDPFRNRLVGMAQC